MTVIRRWTMTCLAALLFILLLSTSATCERVVRVGAFHFAPAIFQAADATVQGHFVDILQAIGREEGIRFEFVYGSWKEGLQRIRSGGNVKGTVFRFTLWLNPLILRIFPT